MTARSARFPLRGYAAWMQSAAGGAYAPATVRLYIYALRNSLDALMAGLPEDADLIEALTSLSTQRLRVAVKAAPVAYGTNRKAAWNSWLDFLVVAGEITKAQAAEREASVLCPREYGGQPVGSRAAARAVA